MRKLGSSIRRSSGWLLLAVWLLSLFLWIATRWRAQGEGWDWALWAMAWGPLVLSVGAGLLYGLFILGYSIGNAIRPKPWVGVLILGVAGYLGWRLGLGMPIYWLWQGLLIVFCLAVLAGMVGEPLGP